ncbi:LysR family transcriptional regulator [Caballeronia concitans]|uniref:LysR family transcriptional regulator n=1 Tax=Caballeronia concitans TaxID=1777133 RepID=A0A658QX96_9BURK|nr:LysR family transcriptional regulator [Caballeronia concitans]KIG03098.1 transcriptional regulator, LysR family [Burkholderia sp. MR1]SAL30956.1 LysR family transcriptional regulator [Caballeronia concitans]
MNLRGLQCFIVLAEELNFSRAAERLHIAQPALSQQIRALEARLGSQLVDRGSRPLRLTEAGSYFHTEAREILQRCEQATLGVRDIGAGTHGWLAIGFTRSAMYSVLPPALKAFHSAYPKVELKLFEMLTEEQADAFRDARIHVGIGRQAPDVPSCTTRTLLNERVMAVLASDHPLAKRKTVRIGELATTPLIVYPKHPAAQFPRLIASLYRDAGVALNIAHEAYEIQTAIALVAAGLGVTYVGESVARHGRSDVVYRHLAGPGAAQITSLTASFRTGDTSPHLQAFLACLPSVDTPR